MGMEASLLKGACKDLEDYYSNASECEKIIIEHACIAGAGGLIPFPIASLVVIVCSTYSMFVRIFAKLGIQLKNNIGKTIVSYMTTCLIGNLGAAVIYFLVPIAADLIKTLPGIGTIIGWIAGPVSDAIVVYVYGYIFLKTITKICKSGKDISEESIKETIAETAKDSKIDIHNTVKEAKTVFKHTDFNEYKAKAETMYEENKDKCINCGEQVDNSVDVCPNCHKNPRKIE